MTENEEVILRESVLEALRILQGAIPDSEENAPAKRFYSLLTLLGVDLYNIPPRTKIAGVDD